MHSQKQIIMYIILYKHSHQGICNRFIPTF